MKSPAFLFNFLKLSCSEPERPFLVPAEELLVALRHSKLALLLSLHLKDGESLRHGNVPTGVVNNAIR